MFICHYDQVAGLHCRRLHSSVPDVWRFSVISRVPVTGHWPGATLRLRDRVKGRNNRWQHRLKREHPTCTERANAHTRVRMEGWRQKRQLGVQAIAFRPAKEMNLSPTTQKRIDNDRPSHGRPIIAAVTMSAIISSDI